MCICVCVFDIFVPTAALIDEPPRLLETIPFGHPYQPVHTDYEISTRIGVVVSDSVSLNNVVTRTVLS